MDDHRALFTKVKELFAAAVDLTEHHTFPNHNLLTRWLPEMIRKNGKITTVFDDVKYILALTSYTVIPPRITPEEAVHFNVGYNACIHVDFEQHELTKENTGIPSGDPVFPFVQNETKLCQQKLAEIPVIIGSLKTETPYGGDLIINGKRRFIPPIRSVMNNFPFRFWKNKGIHMVQIRSMHLDRPSRSTSTIEVFIMRAMKKRIAVGHHILTSLSFQSTIIPLVILVFALGCSPTEFMARVRDHMQAEWNQVTQFKYEIMFRNDTRGVTDRASALTWLNLLYNKPVGSSYAEHVVIAKQVLPHLNDAVPNARFAKLIYLVDVFSVLIRFREGSVGPTDRDMVRYSQIVTAAQSIAILFRILFKKFIEQGVKIVRRVLNQGKSINMLKVFNHTRLTEKIMSAVATGNWSKKRTGVSHQLNCTNSTAILAQLRRVITTTINNDGKHVTPRMISSDSYGYFGPAETPEGEGCGQMYPIASMARITVDDIPDGMMALLILALGPKFTPFTEAKSFAGVSEYRLFDPYGRLVGFVADITGSLNTFITLRQRHVLPPTVTMDLEPTLREWRILAGVGRMIRALVVKERLPRLKTLVGSDSPINAAQWNELVTQGCVEWVCPAIEAIRAPSWFPRSEGAVYIEIADTAMVGSTGATTPFFRMNPGPRLAYWTNMMQQRITAEPDANTGQRTRHRLWYGQKPLVQTRAEQGLDMHEIPSGVNVTIVIAPRTYNQEDALTINRRSLHMGMFGSDAIRQYDTTRNGNSNEKAAERFEPPNPKQTFNMKCGAKTNLYRHLRSDGFPRPGDRVAAEEVICGKTVPVKRISHTAEVHVPRTLQSTEYQNRRRDRSLQVRKNGGGTVSEVVHVRQPNFDVAKISVMTTRMPEVGDKFSSRHGQKGVLGRCEDPENLMFNPVTGMIPDLIMNPHGFASRNTAGKLLEIVLGRAIAESGDTSVCDEQFFEDTSENVMEWVETQLKTRGGFHDCGKEQFIDGISGLPITVKLLSGVVMYSKLTHLAAPKSHARATGPRHIKTRQPNEGRWQNGGLRYGEMEAACTIAYGAEAELHERMFTVSDPHTAHICKQCGFQADSNVTIGMYYCRFLFRQPTRANSENAEHH